MQELKNETIKQFITAGKAIFTLRNESTGNRFTFKVTKFQPEDGKPAMHFVKVLTGSDNNSSYTFIGTIFNDGVYKHSKRSPITPDAQSVKAFEWFVQHVEKLPAVVKVYHEGRCGRCGRRLTVPESILSGFGPECISLVGA